MKRRARHHDDVPAIGSCRSDAHNLFLDAFLRRERDTRREEVDEVGRAGGERLLRGRSAAVSGDLGGDTVLLVITQLVGRIDRRERSVIGNGKPDLDRGLGVRARRPGEEQPDGRKMRRKAAKTIFHVTPPWASWSGNGRNGNR